MFKSAAVLSATVLATASFAGSAVAATITPNPQTGFTLTGNLHIRQEGSHVTCAVTLRGYVPGGGSQAAIITGAFDWGSWECGWLVNPTGFGWTLYPNSSTSVTLMGIAFNTILGSCSGTVTTNWSNAPSGMTFLYATIPGSPAHCTITGTLTAAPALTIN